MYSPKPADKMIWNNFKIAWRNLTKNKVYSFINIFGLAIGMAVTILIGLWIFDEANYNSYVKNSDKIAQIYQTQTFNGRKGTGPAIPRPLEMAMREEFGDKFRHIIMSSWTMPRYLVYEDKNITREGSHLQPGFVDMFSLKILKGDPEGYSQKNEIALSESTARALFGDLDPLGKVVKFNRQDDLLVSAIYEDVPRNNSMFEIDYIVSWEYYLDTQEWVKNAVDRWGNNSFQMYVQIADNQDMDGVNLAINDIKKRNAGEEQEFDPQIFMLPMKDWYLNGNFENGVQTGGRIENLWLFGTIGLFVLLLACINFMNLSTARSEKRAKEVGIRKTLGSERGQLVRQFLSESLFTVLLAFMVAIGIVQTSLSSYNELSGKAISFPWSSGAFWGICALFILFTAFLAGSYPALYLSSFNPVTVLKGTFKAGKNAALPRKALVVVQFTVSVALIIGTMIVMKQVEHGKNRPIGYQKNGLIQIPIMSEDFSGKYDIIRNEFIASGGAAAMASSMSPATAVWSNRSGYTWEGKPEGFQEDFAWVEVSFDYAETMQLEFIEGRDFSREFASDSNAVIINETAVKYMGITDPVGKFLTDEDSDENAEPPRKIIGVVKDMLMQSPYKPVKQTLFLIDKNENLSYYNVRLNPENSVQANLELLEGVFKQHFPDLPFDYEFIDEQFKLKFQTEERIAKLAGIFTLLAIFISCLGLFGLASFVAEQRTKEIGVRKVLGASVANLWLMLSREFVILVTLSLAIAIPVAWFVMQNWIAKFDYRTSIGVWVFVIAGIGAMALTLITISFQAIRVATGNPVNSLRDE